MNIFKKSNLSDQVNNEINTLKNLFNFETPTLFLGINGLVLKCHGSSTKTSFRNAIIESKKLYEFNLIEKINSSFSKKTL